MPFEEGEENRREYTWLIFFAMALGFAWVGYFLGMRPMLRSSAGLAWTETTCAVLEASIERAGGSKDPDDGYRPKVHYRYAVQGRSYESSRLTFDAEGALYKRATAAEMLTGLSPGKSVRCWVDPGDPSVAVLSRQIPRLGLSFLLSLFGVAAFAGSMLVLNRIRFDAWRASLVEQTAERVALRPRNRSFDVIAMGVLALGIIVAFYEPVAVLAMLVSEGQTYWAIAITGFASAALIAAALVVFARVVMSVYVGPRPAFVLSQSTLAPGKDVQLAWTVQRRPEWVRSCQVSLIATKSVIIPDSEYEIVRSRVADRVELLTISTQEIESGSATVTVPHRIAPTLRLPQERLLWKLHVDLAVHVWPDVHEDVTITVDPDDRPQS